MEDDRIVDLYWARNEQAIAESERKYGRLLRSVSYACLGSREDAEECANDTYLEAWNAMPTARPQFLGAFLSKITRRISIDRFRRDHRTKRGGAEALTAELTDCLPDPAEPTPAEAYDAARTRDAINRFLPLAADGNVRIVVGERGGENLWVSRALTDTERTAVRREMESAKRQSAYETAGTDRYLVWVADGDGAVWSPALTYSGGNVTYGTVYDYDPERLPGTAFQNLLSGLIG